MNAHFKSRVIAVVIAGQLGSGVLSAYAADSTAAPAGEQQKVLPELISGAYGVLNVASAFANWFSNRPGGSAFPNVAAQPNPVGYSAPMQMPAPSAMPMFGPSYAATPIIVGQPDMPLNPGAGGYSANQPWSPAANYQGVQVTVLVLNQQNQPVETRSLNANFKSGERFRLQLVSTFEALASVDAYRTSPDTNGSSGFAQSWAGQLYPARAEQVIKMRAGELVQLPMGANEYFTFDNQTGLDRLMLNVRHPQAKGTLANSQPVYRQDSGQNSTFMQLAPQGNYPAVSQLLTFRHNP